MDADPKSPLQEGRSSAFHAASCYASSCGRVTLYLGDSLEIVPTLESVDAIISDPPYGILKTHNWGSTGAKREAEGMTNQSGRDWGKQSWDKKQNLPILDVPMVYFGGQYYTDTLPQSNAWLCFNKRGDGKSSGTDFGDCELAWTNGTWNTVRMYSQMWHGKARWSREPSLHIAQKPVPLMAWCMDQLEIGMGATVLDPFMGSGTTGIACIRTGRKFIGVERDPAHYATALERIRREIEGDLFHSQHNL